MFWTCSTKLTSKIQKGLRHVGQGQRDESHVSGCSLSCLAENHLLRQVMHHIGRQKHETHPSAVHRRTNVTLALLTAHPKQGSVSFIFFKGHSKVNY